MNLKERGFTIGDLTILLFVILFTFFTINKIKELKIEKQRSNLFHLEMPEKLVNK